MVLLFLLFGVVVPTILAISAAVLKHAVKITNMVAGGRKPTDVDFEFRGNSNIPVLKSKEGILIPEPSPAYAFGIVLILYLLNILVQAVVAIFAFGVSISTLGTEAGLSKTGGR